MGLTVGTYNPANAELVQEALLRIHAILRSTPLQPAVFVFFSAHHIAPEVLELMTTFNWSVRWIGDP